MKLSKHFLSKEENLRQEAILLEKSVSWWEEEVNLCLSKIDEFEKLESLSKKQIQDSNKNIEKLKYLLSKTDFEYKNIGEIEKRIENFILFRKVIEKCK